MGNKIFEAKQKDRFFEFGVIENQMFRIASEFVTQIIRTQKLCIICIIAAYIFSHKAKTQYFHMEKQTQIWKPFFYGEYLSEKLLSQLGMHFPTGVCSKSPCLST